MREREILATVKRLYASSRPTEEILVFLRKEGASKIESIRFLHLGTGVDLGEAKKAVFHSLTWSDRFASDEEFLDSLLKSLDQIDHETAA